ncbi:phytoene desaturase family protein [Capillimicrobium parvum]|uniref:Pyridine nucleotide-disulfide oxidoreductase domain-containing protein 2 n=1 Tax=Capillimicrobium parvum TaxID=2884022 RepID=A0A9E6XWX7_9ACTN|nr:NAD(P)/FAD-dependent oxidoreductase [Capillimicrobium parvum]UGS35317.1 4,4'-diapophytoene desaturase (4,4'-diapolycopene-forming) [Capillimicrobium parvum]
MDAYDGIVVGGGHNGLVAAIELARAGWRILILEQGERLGGAVMSAEITRPGFVHDLYSTNQNTFRGGLVYGVLGEDLERHGLRYATTDKPFANAFPGGRVLKVYQDAERTLAGLREHDPGDADGWLELKELFDRLSPAIFELYGSALPSWAAAMAAGRALRRLGVKGAAEGAQLLLSSTRELGDLYMSSPEAKALLATWGMHPDFGPDVSAGAMFPFVEVFSDAAAGMSIVEGGASRMIDALAAVLADHGGAARTGAAVRRILTDGDRATGVELESGERIGATRAVVASVTPTALYGRLLEGGPVRESLRREAARYRYGPGTMMVHVALSAPPAWAAGGDLGEFAYVHIAPYVADLADTYTAASNGLLPSSPLLIVGQSSAVDPSRAPAGRAVLWVQVRALPARIRGDAAGEITASDWREAAEPYADRVIAKLAEYAPGIDELILDRAVLTPADLEAHDPNLVGGDSVAGSHHLRQNFAFRPLRSTPGYRTPVEGLYMTGAATWPGGGVTGLSGHLAAQTVLGGSTLSARAASIRRRLAGGK